jgi:hypothetical protein
MVARMWALHTAIGALIPTCTEARAKGAFRLSYDIVEAMEKCAAGFETECLLRIEKGARD